MKPRTWKKKAFRYMKKVMIPKIPLVFASRKAENEYAHKWASDWVKQVL